MQSYLRNIPKKYRTASKAFQFLDHFLGRRLAFSLTRPLRKKVYDGMYKTMQQHRKGELFEVDRIENLEEQVFIEEYLLKNKPVIFSGKANDWDCVKNWSLAYLKELHGDDEIIIVNQEDVENTHEELTLGELIDGIGAGLARYYRFYPLIQRHPERLLDFDYKWMQAHRHQKIKYDAFQVFIGPDESYTPLHNANPGNLFTQVCGEKEWILFPEYYTPVLDPNPVRSNYRTAPIRKEYGPYNPFDPEHESPYHLFEYCDRYKAHLKPGDVLYVPPYWWHAVKNIGHSIGVGYRWLPLQFNFKHNKLLSILDLCTTRPFVWKTWKLSQIDPNLTHMAEVGKLKEYMKSKEV